MGRHFGRLNGVGDIVVVDVGSNDGCKVRWRWDSQ